MKANKNESQSFHLPAYTEIPSVGLYLDQTSKYINECLGEIADGTITNSMISNYVKHHLIANPIKKQYGRDQIAYLLFITLCKPVLSLEQIDQLLKIQKDTCECKDAYEIFCGVFEQNLKEKQKPVSKSSQQRKILLENVVQAMVQHIFLNQLLSEQSE